MSARHCWTALEIQDGGLSLLFLFFISIFCLNYYEVRTEPAMVWPARRMADLLGHRRLCYGHDPIRL